MIRGAVTGVVLFGAIAAMLAGCAHTPPRSEAPDRKAPPASAANYVETRKQAAEIGMQPARDVGLLKRKVPPVLEDALADPYSTRGLKTCAQLAAAVRTLTEALGPDYRAGVVYRENRAGKLAAAGGKTVINSIIPYRSLVREITGAAPADRHMNAVIDAGLARRGFLRGLQQKQRCKTTP
ncbi:MAG: hypothetical protein ACREE0_06940 [Phenylobacterium sp.]